MRPRPRRSLAWLLALGLALTVNLVLILAPPSWIESLWSARLWPIWPAVTARLHAASPFALTPLLAVLLALVAWRLAPGRGRHRIITASLLWTAALVSTFHPTWGAAYRRPALDATLQLRAAGADRALLLDALEQAVAVVRSTAPERPLARLDPASDAAALTAAVSAFASCVADLDEAISGRRVAVPERVRDLPEGMLLRFGYAGITLPWLLEPYVDAGLPPASYLSVAGHELAHAAGWAREADTDAVAILAGLACEHRLVRYASALHAVQALTTSLQPLLGADGPDRERAAAAIADLPGTARAEREALGEAVRRWRNPALAGVVSTVYDGYLRSQGVEAGVADYDAAGALVAAALAACDAATSRPWCP